MAEDFTAKFRVDISDLKKNITEANKQIKLANATFKAQTAGMEDWTKDADGLSKKLEQLKTVLSNQKSILTAYREQLSRQEKAYDENGAKVDQLKAKLKELADNGVSKADEEYKKYQTALRNVLKEQQNSATAADDLRLKILSQEAAIGKTEKQLRNYEKAANDLGNESKDAVKDLNSMDDALEKVGDEAGKADGKLSAIGSTLAKGFAAGIAAVTAAVGAGVTALAKSTESAAQYADEINTLSKVTGMSTESLQAYQYAAELVDVSMETLTGSMAKNVKSMSNAANGSKKYVKAYEDIGVAVTNADGSLRDSETVFWEAVDALGKIQNETERDAIAMQLFGKSARDLNPLIEAGSGEIAKLTDEAKNMGAVMSQDSLDKLSAFDDSMQRLKGGAAAAKNALGTVLLPVLQELADDGVDLIGKFTNELNKANGDTDKIGEAIGNLTEQVGNKLVEFIPNVMKIGGDIVSSLGKSLVSALPKLGKAATSVVTALSKQLAAGLPKFISAGSEVIKSLISGFSSSLPELLQTITGSLPDVIGTVVTLVSDLASHADEIIVPLIAEIPRMISGIVSGFMDNLDSLVDGAVNLVTGLVDGLPTIIEGFIEAIPTIIEKVNQGLATAVPKLIEGATQAVVSLVGHLPEIIQSLVDSIPDIIRSIFSNNNGFLSAKNISSLVSGAVDVVMSLVENLPTIISELIGAIPDIIAAIFDTKEGFLSPKNIESLVDGAVKTVGKLVENIPRIIGGLIGAIPNVIESIVGAFGSLPARLFGLGEETMGQFGEGISSALRGGVGMFLGGIPGLIAGLISGNNDNSAPMDLSGMLEEYRHKSWRKMVDDIRGRAVGDIVTKPTLSWIGEDGAEAVVPLEKHTGWIRKLANQLAATTNNIGGATYNNQKTIQFTQNITSPKPLRRWDIYRQTHNGLNLAKEMM